MESRSISYGAAVRSCNTLFYLKTLRMLRMFLAVRKIILRYDFNRRIDIHWMFSCEQVSVLLILRVSDNLT